ncbi:hypothetical protein KY334_05750 [Candidatus Woesearchaeota archaeon]|nr:hypothetical protein [Candidatus Woesearchaeota archaeon]
MLIINKKPKPKSRYNPPNRPLVSKASDDTYRENYDKIDWNSEYKETIDSFLDNYARGINYNKIDRDNGKKNTNDIVDWIAPSFKVMRLVEMGLDVGKNLLIKLKRIFEIILNHIKYSLRIIKVIIEYENVCRQIDKNIREYIKRKKRFIKTYKKFCKDLKSKVDVKYLLKMANDLATFNNESTKKTIEKIRKVEFNRKLN